MEPMALGGDIRCERAGSQMEVARRGAALRRLVVDGVDLLAPAPQGAAAVAEYWGSVLAPWPNRLEDGIFWHDGNEYQVPVNDTTFGSALHGLLGQADFSVRSQGADQITLEATCGAPNYPSRLRVSVTYQLVRSGISAWIQATNVGSSDVPVALGAHPYLEPAGSVDDVLLALPATSRVVPDDRLLPQGLIAQSLGPDDFVPIAGQHLDHTYGGLVRGHDGRIVASMQRADGRVVQLWAGDSCRWLQVFTADTLPAPRTRAAVAIEPMTCPPNGLRSGEDVVVLPPGGSHDLQWGLSLVPGQG